MKPLKEGTVYGYLTVLSNSTRKSKGKIGKVYNEAITTCICDCGMVKDIVRSELVRKRTKSCGCHRLDHVRSRKTKTHDEIIETIDNGIAELPKEYYIFTYLENAALSHV